MTVPPGADPSRLAVISLHTSPLDPPGSGDAGGMNVFVREVTTRLGARGIEVDVFTRCAGRGVPEVEVVAPGVRVIQTKAGPCAPVLKEDLPELVPSFLASVRDRLVQEGGAGYDLVHAHYWLSGIAALGARWRWGAPLVASFHSLAKVKVAADPTTREPAIRIQGEELVVREADRLVVPTPLEASHLVELYGADPAIVRVVPPGVDPSLFRPRDTETARAALGLAGHRVALFAGRLQPLKGADVAVRAVARAVRKDPAVAGTLVLVVVGGPAGSGDEVGRLRGIAAAEGIGDRVRFLPPVHHDGLPELLAAADVVLVPSRSESFGLVALEALAAGRPVVAAATGGLPQVVGGGGFLVHGHDPEPYADRVLRILSDPKLAQLLGEAGVRHAFRYPWEAATERLLHVYRGVTDRTEAATC